MERDPQDHWLETETALHYARAAVRVGIWASERSLLERHFTRIKVSSNSAVAAAESP